MKIAALSCSYNRIKTTSRFLKSIVNQDMPDGYTMDIYLLDDNSPDGTAAYVQSHFPTVKVENGSGSLFWAGGMRTLWKRVMEKDEYDFYLLLNDDVVLKEGAIKNLVSAHALSNHDGNIIMGTVLDSSAQYITYGGWKLTNKITGNAVFLRPDNEKLLACEIGNANIMLVDKATVKKIGILSEHYTHGIADYDYTLTGVKNGVKAWVAPGYYGNCDNDHMMTWLPHGTPLKKRVEYLYSPKGLGYKQFLRYTWKHFPLSLPVIFVKLWVKTLFPVLYDKYKKDKLYTEKQMLNIKGT
ncbi:glycosyltransferase family 2 protein [Mucilaginibacter panaciglaebae]